MNLDKTKTLNLNDIVQIDFPDNQYIQNISPKKQICIHHSAGWDNARGMFAGWAADSQRVATCCAINDEGTIFQAFSSRYYGWHINPYSKGNQLTWKQRMMRSLPSSKYEEQSIGVEILNWGPVQLRNGEFFTWVGNFGLKGRGVTIPENKIVEYAGEGWRGYKNYERYTDQEMQSLYELLKFWMDRYEIPCNFSHELFEIREEALRGDAGVFSHCSYRTDKFDCHPQHELIQVLNALRHHV